MDEAACAQPTPTLSVAFDFSLGGEVEGLLSSKAAQYKLRIALSDLMDGLARPEDISLSVVPGSVIVLGRTNIARMIWPTMIWLSPEKMKELSLAESRFG